MATIKELADEGPDGSRLGRTSTNLVSFFGATPIVRPTTATVVTSTAITEAISTAITAAVTTAITGPAATAATNLTSQFGFVTSTQADALNNAVLSLIARVASIEVAINSTILRAATLVVTVNSVVARVASGVVAVNTIKTNLEELGLMG